MLQHIEVRQQRAERVFYSLAGCGSLTCPRRNECLRASDAVVPTMTDRQSDMCERGIIPVYVPRRH